MCCIDKFKTRESKQVLCLPQTIKGFANLSMNIRNMTCKIKFIIKKYTEYFYGRLGIIRNRFFISLTLSNLVSPSLLRFKNNGK